MENRNMISDDQIKHVLDEIISRQKGENPVTFGMEKKDKNWMVRVGVGHTLSLMVLIIATLFGFGWSMNNRMTAVEINQQYSHDTLVEVKRDVTEVKKDTNDTKREVLNLSSKLGARP